MKDKYYIPDITEFRYKFEYEMIPSIGIAIIDFGEPTSKFEVRYCKEYIKCIYGIKSANLLDDDYSYINRAIEDKKIRVKYLDLDDIRSLDFTSFSNRGNVLTYNKNEDIQLYFNDKVDNLKLGIGITIYYDTHRLFDGYIKNKDELKTLLRQLDLNSKL